MTKTTTETKGKTILIVAICLTIALIWGQSILDPKDSSAESHWVLEFLERLFGSGFVTENVLRKAAHFCEYAVLGAELLLFFHTVPMAVAHALFTAATDETIQYFSGRGSMLLDVWLDTAGALFGAAVMLLILRIIGKKSPVGQNAEAG